MGEEKENWDEGRKVEEEQGETATRPPIFTRVWSLIDMPHTASRLNIAARRPMEIIMVYNCQRVGYLRPDFGGTEVKVRNCILVSHEAICLKVVPSGLLCS